MNKLKYFRCSSCLNISTRPRIVFDKNGECNACQWMKEKKTINWESRINEFKKIVKKYKSHSYFDCIIPVSGGKDSSYVSYKIKHEFNLTPLCITVRPPLSLSIGDENLNNFINHGYDHIHITPNAEIMREINLIGFDEMGFPYYGWLISIYSSIIRTSFNFNIPLVIYGEDGEVEYGGSNKNRHKALFDIDYLIKSYLETGYKKVLELFKKNSEGSYWFTLPNQNDLKNKKIALTHWSYFENWDPYRNYLLAKEKCGLVEYETPNESTFTNFAQTDQALYALHMYLCFVKFGFGRATQDAGIEIRRGAMTREQGINLVNLYDGQYPEQFIDLYLDYFRITKKKFDSIIRKWANKNILSEEDSGVWKLKFKIN